MASIDLEDEALMEQDYYGDDDEELEMPPMVAPLSPLTSYNESAGNAENQGSAEAGILDGLLGEPEAGAGDEKPKRLVKRKPQPKLDEELLTGPRGLPSLKKHFERVKFKGKGHEVEDLSLLMGEMEHWLNRLYPKLTMKEMIMKMEKLGKKQKVKTCVSKIRLDMPILPEDFVGGEDEVDDVLRGDDDGIERLGEEEESQPVAAPIQPASKTLTEEQRKRMEEKKREALERKAAKRARLMQDDPSGISQEELDSMQADGDASLAQTEANMMAEIDEMEEELSRKTSKGPSSSFSQVKGSKPSVAESGLTAEEMDEIERELMG